MLSKGKPVTLRKLNNVMTSKEYTLLGARYTNDSLEREIPITTVIEDGLVDVKKETMTGCIYFRPVGESQTRALSIMQNACKHFGYGEFLDESIEEPLLRSGLEADVLLPDSAFSNIQEIPFNFWFSYPEIFCEEVTIQGRKHSQYTITDTIDVDPYGVKQELVLLFRKAEYDGETLLGAYKETKLTRSESIKLLQFIGNGSLLQQVIGAVTISSDSAISTITPLFNDVRVEFSKSGKGVPLITINADTGSVLLHEEDLKNIHIESPNYGTYRVVLHVGKDKVTLLIG